ncbi:hypothetical protein AYO40_01215 [Planctomycetaceae bacterium SCGC AG-212-D15]|nr:hypothetical protein AYO40_01215 [Planctomycetaceae bacterium SCGC AG-212-D15]
MDKAYLGRDAIITMKLTNWNEGTYRLIAERMNNTDPGPPPRGTDDPTSIGALIGSQGLAAMLWLQFPYATQAGQTVKSFVGLPAGYRFLCAYPTEEKIMPGMRINKLQLTWHAIKVNALGEQQNQVLFDHDMSACPQLPSIYA